MNYTYEDFEESCRKILLKDYKAPKQKQVLSKHKQPWEHLNKSVYKSKKHQLLGFQLSDSTHLDKKKARELLKFSGFQFQFNELASI